MFVQPSYLSNVLRKVKSRTNDLRSRTSFTWRKKMEAQLSIMPIQVKGGKTKEPTVTGRLWSQSSSSLASVTLVMESFIIVYIFGCIS